MASGKDPGDEDPSPADVLHDTKVLQQFSEKAGRLDVEASSETARRSRLPDC